MTWQYIAGFFDGEGCITYTSEDRLQLSVSQKRPKVIYRIQEFLALNGIESVIYIQKSSQHVLRIKQGKRKENAIKFLNLIFPFLVCKRTVVQDFLRFMKIFPGMNKQVKGISKRLIARDLITCYNYE